MCVSNIAFLLPTSDSNHLRGREEESRKDKKEEEEEVVKEEKEKLSSPEAQAVKIKISRSGAQASVLNKISWGENNVLPRLKTTPGNDPGHRFSNFSECKNHPHGLLNQIYEPQPKRFMCLISKDSSRMEFKVFHF